MNKRERRLGWMGEHPSVKGWIERLSPSTRVNYLRYAYNYFHWVEKQPGWEGKGPEDLLDLQERAEGRRRYEQVSLLQRWVDQQPGTTSAKRVLYSSVRSFYAHNHVPLPRDVTYRVRGDKEPVQKLLSFEDLRKILLTCNPTYQAVFLIMFQGALGCAEWEYFNTKCWSQVRPQLEQGKKRLKIRFPGRKHARYVKPYYTFVGRDGVEALQRYLKERRGPIRRGEAIVLNDRGQPVTRGALERYFIRHAAKAGVITLHTPNCPACGGKTRKVRKWLTRERWKGPWTIFYVCDGCGKETPASELPQPRDIRYRVSPHELRDLFRSEWELSPAKTVCAEFSLGHDIDPNDYNKIMELYPDWAETQYALAEPFLNVMSEDPRRVSVNRVKRLQNQLEEERRRRESLERQLRTELGPLLKFGRLLEEHPEIEEEFVKLLLKWRKES